MTGRRRAIGAALAAAIAVVMPAAVAPAVGQAAAYRYWSYWLGADDTWSFASVGPAFRVPADGSLEGWRHSVSGVEGNDAPAMAADFEAVCGATAPQDGRKRVAVVVDPGSSSDAPEGEQVPGAWAMCVVADEGATGYDVLRAAAGVRTQRGLICAIGGYPANGCAEVVADPTPKPTPTASKEPKPSQSPKPALSPSTPADPPDATPIEPSPTPSDPTLPAGAAEPSETPASPTPDAGTPSSSLPPSEISTPSPQPTYSLLTAPLPDPPAGGGTGGVLVAGIAVVGIAGLGGAAILRMRRSS